MIYWVKFNRASTKNAYVTSWVSEAYHWKDRSL